MSSSDERRQRDLDLLMKSYKALEAEQADPGDEPEPAPTRRSEDRRSTEAPVEDDDSVMMYRGRPIRKGSSGTPGAGSGQGQSRQFRGAGGQKKKKPASADQLKAALKKLTELHREGLITQAEYDAKRLQILDRL